MSFLLSLYIFTTNEGVSAPTPKQHTGSDDITHSWHTLVVSSNITMYSVPSLSSNHFQDLKPNHPISIKKNYSVFSYSCKGLVMMGIFSRTTDTQRGNRLHRKAKKPLPNLYVRPKHIGPNFQISLVSLGVRSPWVFLITNMQVADSQTHSILSKLSLDRL